MCPFCVSGDQPAAFPAANHAAVEVRLERGAFWLASSAHCRLDRVKQLLSDQGLVLAGVSLALVFDYPEIDGIDKQPVVLAAG